MNAMNGNLSSAAYWQLMVRIAATACIVSCCLVLFDLWDNRDLFDPKGISYLDMTDAYQRGEWRAALIGLWSPLTLGGAFLTLLCAIVLMNLRHVSIFRGIAEHWFVLVPIGTVRGLYSLLHFEGRYIAAYVVVLWMVLFRSIAIPYSLESKRIFTVALATAALIVAMTLAAQTGQAVLHTAQYFTNSKNEAPFFQSGYTNWKVANYLQTAGLHEGKPVGSVGWTFSAYWARMARLHVIAEVPKEGRVAFWSSEGPAKAT